MGQSLRVLLARPRGFCAGVVRAIECVEHALDRYGPPIYVRHEIVHNAHVVEELRTKGVHFVRQTEEIPLGGIAVFSAHGVSRKVETEARNRDLQVIDATCPLVTKVHNEAKRYARQGCEVVLVGHAEHPEVEGTMGQVPGKVYLVSTLSDVATLDPTNPARLSYVTQTTLSVDDTREIVEALKARFPEIKGPRSEDICYATQNRQQAVKRLAEVCDAILVVGADYSSNSNRLREVAAAAGCRSYLIPDAGNLDPAWLHGVQTLGITAGASAPERLVQGLVDRLGELFDMTLSELDGPDENMHFALPRQLRAVGDSAI